MKRSFSEKFLAVFLSVILLMTCMPLSVMAATSDNIVSHIADPSTMDSWEDVFLPDGVISTENAGGVWMDKSVFTNTDDFTNRNITQKDDNAFVVALSAMVANMSVTGKSFVSTDTMLILDVSGSMNDNSDNNDVAEELVDAANESIASLLAADKHNRVGVVLYSGPTTQGGATSSNDAILILPLGRYETGRNGEYLTYSISGNNTTTETVSLSSNVVYEGTNNAPFSRRPSKTVEGGTYIQKGIMLAAEQFTDKDNETTVNDDAIGVVTKKPVMVLMSDGSPTVSSTNFQNPTTINLGDGTTTSAAQGFVNHLTAAYAKKMIEAKYNTESLFYTIGLGVSDDTIAVSVLNPGATTGTSVAVNDFWSDWEDADVGDKITVQVDNRGNPTRTVTKIDGLEQNYVDEYLSVDDADNLGAKLIQAFADVIESINLQSKYTPTLISHLGEDLSGYISFVDKIGEYMTVTDIKGILIDDILFSGADLSSNFVEGGGRLGTYDNPTELGHEMVAAVRQRLGLPSNDAARTLIGLAYENGQISYNKRTGEFSNYIGWYANAAGEFLGFYHEGLTVLPEATGNAATDPVYTIKSYGYLGKVDAEHGVSESDMMYATVQVRHNIKTGEERVAFAVPAALIPVMTYEVSLDSDGDISALNISGAENPIRLVYEVALDSHINEWNVKEVVSAEYLAENTNSDGSINFYSNDWEHGNTTGYNTVNTYSYFNPSRQNEKYYYTKDAPVYTNNRGSLYEGSSAPSSNGTFYRAYTVYEKDGNALSTKTVYRKLSVAALETAVKTQGTNYWHIPMGNVHVNLDGYTVTKASNDTATLSVANEPFVDTHNHSVGDAGYNFYVGATLGNNGKLTLEPETGIKLSKSLAANETATNEAFEFVLTKKLPSASSHKALLVSPNGSQTATSVSFNSSGVAVVNLNAGQTIYIGSMSAGEVINITESDTAGYIATVNVDGTQAVNPCEVTISNSKLTNVNFINANRGTGNLTVSKEITHPFGTDYQIPSALEDFEITVTLSGIGTANANFVARKTNGGITSVTTDAQGRFVVSLAHDEQITVFGLPTGTLADVVETKYSAGFTPTYWNNGVKSEASYGEVKITRNNTVSVIVENSYAPAAVYPVNINLGGTKNIINPDGSAIDNWDDDYEFEIILQRFNTTSNKWEDVGTETVDKNNKSFTFDMSTEVYDAPGVYSYQLFEEEPEIGSTDRVGGIIYDTVWHTFSVYVNDTDMDGQLEIVRVHSNHANKDFELVQGEYTITTDFTNIQSTEIPALATIDIQKELVNDADSNRVNLAGYNFELYTDADCTVPATNIDGEIKIERNPTDAVGEGWIDIVLSKTTEADAPYVFYLKEAAGSVNGMTYDTKVIKVVITVTNSTSVNGALVADVQYFDLNDNPVTDLSDEDELVFTNEYTVDAINYPINFVSKKLTGRDMAVGEFKFALRDLSGSVIAEGTNSSAAADGEAVNITFNKPLTFTKVGTYSYNIVETTTDGNGITSDKTIYYIVVRVADNNGTLVASHSVVNAADNEILFENSYEAADTTYAISGTKELTGRILLNDEFTFVLTEALNADGDIAENAKTYEARNRIGGGFTFPEITYTQAGTYYYVVSEKQSSGSSYGIMYDTTEYVVTVTVTDDTTVGKLVASANYSASELKFNNSYAASPVSGSIPGNKTLTGKTLEDGQFSFELYKSNATWQYLSKLQTVSNDADGFFAFDFVDYTVEDPDADKTEFTKVGTYYYLIKEINGGSTIKGITYDDIVYRVRVVITDDLLGQLHATVHIYDNGGVPQEGIIFENKYEITGEDTVTLNGTKTLNGIVPENRTFEFELYEANSNYEVSEDAVQKVSQDENGIFSFDITYTPEDISDTPYYYVVKEVNAGQRIEGITYDDTEYQIAVMVEDDGEGSIKTTAVIMKDEELVTTGLDFENTYNAEPAKVVFDGRKELAGNRELKDGDFEFEIFNANENFEAISSAAPAVRNDENGEFEFAEIELDTAKAYYFVAKENIENTLGGITYDTSEYHITVNVIDNNKGNLEIEEITYIRVNGELSAEAETLLFENSYKASDVSVTVEGTKLLENRELEENEFKFLLYPADEMYEIIDDEAVKEAKNTSDGSFSFGDITFGEIGTYFFVIKEDAETTAERITNDTTVYYLEIEIKDDENGRLYEESRTVTKADSDEEVEEIVFTNVFTPRPEDITVDIDVIKTVANKGSEEIGPEGFEFVLENIESEEKWSFSTDEQGNAVHTLNFTENAIGNTYTYKLTEVNDSRENVQYSTEEYIITVSVSLNENNELIAALTIDGEEVSEVVAEFENVYDYTPEETTTEETTTEEPTTEEPTTEEPTTEEPTTEEPTTEEPTTEEPTTEEPTTEEPTTEEPTTEEPTTEEPTTEEPTTEEPTTEEPTTEEPTTEEPTTEEPTTEEPTTEEPTTEEPTTKPEPEFTDSPQTDDTTNLMLWFALMFISGGGILGMNGYSKKRKENEAN